MNKRIESSYKAGGVVADLYHNGTIRVTAPARRPLVCAAPLAQTGKFVCEFKPGLPGYGDAMAYYFPGKLAGNGPATRRIIRGSADGYLEKH